MGGQTTSAVDNAICCEREGFNNVFQGWVRERTGGKGGRTAFSKAIKFLKGRDGEASAEVGGS